MTLRFKRNYPLVLMLIGILSILGLTMGNQPIVSYTVNIEAFQTVQLTAITSDLTQLTGLLSAQNIDAGLQVNPIQP